MTDSPKTVLVTGASTGIGRAAVLHLANRGWTVFAGVRKTADGDELKSDTHGDVRPLVLDVTKDGDVHKAVETISAALNGRRLGGLVNNAGIAKMGPLAIQKLEDFEAHFEVNVFGMMRVTQAMVPLLGSDATRTGAPGRIINITSVGGKVSAPFLGAYTATKHANESMTDTLRRELVIYGIDAIAIGPGSVKTPIWDKAEKANEAGPYTLSDWGKPLEKFEETMLEGGRNGLDPIEIARTIETALSDDSPKARYAPVPSKFTNFTVPKLLPKRWLDRIFQKRFGLEPPAAR